jgi:HEAT repeat protein
MKARALWLLTKLEGKGQKYVEMAIKDTNPDIRITGLRAARELKIDVIPYVKQLVNDPEPQVRRECAIALHHNDSSEAAGLWAQLAKQYDGKDRWYLEAVGIGADKQWGKFYPA